MKKTFLSLAVSALFFSHLSANEICQEKDDLIQGVHISNCGNYEIDADVYVASYQFADRLDKYPTHKIQSQAGVGVTFDFRGDAKSKVDGISPIVQFSYYADGRGNPYFSTILGARARKWFYSQYFWEVNVGLSANIHRKYDDIGNVVDNSKITMRPSLSGGVGYLLNENNILKANIQYFTRDAETKDASHALLSVSLSF